MAHVPGWLKRRQVLLESRLTPAAHRWYARGLRAEHLSLAQAPLAATAAALIVLDRFLAAFAVLLASVVLDLLDGFFARATGTASARGHALDKAMDLFGIYAFLLAVAVARPGLWPPVALAAAATAVLYVLGWVFDPELVPGVRAAGLAWLLVPGVTLLLWLPGVAGLLQVPYLLVVRRPKDAYGARSSGS